MPQVVSKSTYALGVFCIIDNNVLANDIPQHFHIKVLGDINFAHLEL